MRHLRIAFILASVLRAVGWLGFGAVIVVLVVQHPAGDPAATSPPWPLLATGVVFIVGAAAVTTIVRAITRRLPIFRTERASPLFRPTWGYTRTARRSFWRFIRSGDVGDH